MTTPAEPETGDTSERYLRIARRWFTEGWTGDLAMADDIFGEDLRTNGVHVGAAGPVGRIRERLAGVPDLTTSIQDQFGMLKQIGYLPDGVRAA